MIAHCVNRASIVIMFLRKTRPIYSQLIASHIRIINLLQLPCVRRSQKEGGKKPKIQSLLQPSATLFSPRDTGRKSTGMAVQN